MELMAHRGASGIAPENTLAAFRRCLEYLPDWIELDVHATSDGEIVVMHDATVDRTTDGTGSIGELTLAQIKALDAGSWKGAEFAGEPVPTLAEVAELVGEAARLNVEIKAGPDVMRVVGQVIDILREGTCLLCAMVSSFEVEAVRAARALTDEPAVALITGRAEDLQIARDEGFGWINVNHAQVTPQFVKQAHGKGIDVCIWTMDDLSRWEEFKEMGVNVFCTNMAHLAPPLEER
jgi:glycerophosphoryl diester phosphodiesterase